MQILVLSSPDQRGPRHLHDIADAINWSFGSGVARR
jgi:hypothetical protein